MAVASADVNDFSIFCDIIAREKIKRSFRFLLIPAHLCFLLGRKNFFPVFFLVFHYTKSQIILMIQNFGSKPNSHCKTITDVVMIIGFLYFMIFSFIRF